MTKPMRPPPDNLPVCREAADLLLAAKQTQVEVLRRVADAEAEINEDDIDIDTSCRNHGIDVTTFRCLTEAGPASEPTSQRATTWDLINAPGDAVDVSWAVVQNADGEEVDDEEVDGEADSYDEGADSWGEVSIDVDVDEMRHTLWVACQHPELIEECHFDAADLEDAEVDADVFLRDMLAVARLHGVEVKFCPADEIGENLSGMLRCPEAIILIDETLGTAGAASVLAHELVHLHDITSLAVKTSYEREHGINEHTQPLDDDESRAEREFVAEAVAHVVCAHYGFDTTNRYVFAAHQHRPVLVIDNETMDVAVRTGLCVLNLFRDIARVSGH